MVGRRSPWLALIVAAGLSACGGDMALLLTVRCDTAAVPPCAYEIPNDIDWLSIALTQPAHNPPARTEILPLGAADRFPVSLSVTAGDGAQEGEVFAEVEARSGGATGTVRAAGSGNGPLTSGEQTEIIVTLVPQ